MNNETNKNRFSGFERIINKISYRGQRNKKLQEYRVEYEKYISMQEDAFTMEYIETNAMYEHKKLKLSLIFITFIATIVMNVWKLIYEVMIQLLVMKNMNDQAFIQVAQVISCFIILVTFLIATLIVFSLFRNLYKISKKSMFLKELKEMRKRNNG